MSNNTLYHLLSFIYAVLSRLKINLVGALGGNEILATGFSLSIRKWKDLYHSIPALKKVNLAYFTFLLAQIMSDLVNQSSMNNMLRGWANIVMAIIVTNFLAGLLWRQNKNLIYYLSGSIVSILLFGELTGEDVDLEKMGFFKFNLVPALNAFLMIVSWYLIRKSPKSTLQIVALFVLYGLFNIAFDSRSNGVIFIIVAILFYKKENFKQLTFKGAIPYLIAFLMLFQGLYILYISQVLAGNIGGEHSREQLSRIDNPYNAINLLMTGRTEVYVGLVAALDKPIFGHGSWAPDPGGKYNLLAFQLHDTDDKFESFVENREGGLIIPSHSVLMGAWMTAGILGFLAVLYIVYIFYKNAFSLIRSGLFQQNAFFIIVLLYTITASWTFLFSPLPHIKQTLPIMISCMLVMNRKKEIVLLKKRRKSIRQKLSRNLCNV